MPPEGRSKTILSVHAWEEIIKVPSECMARVMITSPHDPGAGRFYNHLNLVVTVVRQS